MPDDLIETTTDGIRGALESIQKGMKKVELQTDDIKVVAYTIGGEPDKN